MIQLGKKILPKSLKNVISDKHYQKYKIKKYQALRTSEKDGYTLEGYDRLKSIYVHIPKNAGISVSKGIYGNRGGGHLTALEYQKVFGARTFSEYFKFTIARNPWDRVHSAYHFLKSGGFNADDKAWSKNHLEQFSSFREFVINGLNQPDIQNGLHFRPQYLFILDSKKKSVLVDFVGYLETLEDDFDFLCHKLKISSSLPYLNHSNKKDYRQSYSELMVNKVGDIYRNDIELLGYDFNSIVSRIKLPNANAA